MLQIHRNSNNLIPASEGWGKNKKPLQITLKRFLILGIASVGMAGRQPNTVFVLNSVTCKDYSKLFTFLFAGTLWFYKNTIYPSKTKIIFSRWRVQGESHRITILVYSPPGSYWHLYYNWFSLIYNECKRPVRRFRAQPFWLYKSIKT
jgi:hypothetical protein